MNQHMWWHKDFERCWSGCYLESHGTSRCLPYSAKVDHSRHGLGWNSCALNDLIWTFLYISFWWNNWLMSQILKDAFCILIVKFLSFRKKHQANPVALDSVLRGWRFTPGCFGGWRCCLGALWPTTKNPEILAEILERVLDCWTLFVWLLNMLLRYFDYEIIYYILLRVLFPLPRLPKTGVCSWSRFLFRSGFGSTKTHWNQSPIFIRACQGGRDATEGGWSVDV